MTEQSEAAFDVLAALAALFIFAAAFGLALDNHAARLDPASPYHTVQ